MKIIRINDRNGHLLNKLNKKIMVLYYFIILNAIIVI